MPPNAHQDVRGSSAGGLAMTMTSPPPATATAAAASKMDCFLTTVCTPLHIQVRTQVPACLPACLRLRHVQARGGVASRAKELN
jgi:hypothetical protein